MQKFKSDFMNEMQIRGFINQCSDIDALDNALLKPSVAYLGSDPTADSLHVGHLVPVMMMRWFQKFGHKPILLVGGATGHIGDPDKDVERPLLTSETIAKNCEGLKKSYSKFLNFSDKSSNCAIMEDNYNWFKDINYLSFLRDIGVVVSVNKLINLDRIKKRLDQDLHLSFLELNYPLFQSYDFLMLHKLYGCSLQICGADQWGNAIGGIDLIQRKAGKDAFVLTAPLLTTSSGKKMGKSEGNAVWINEDKASSYDYYQFFRNVEDSMVGKCLRLFTELPIDEIEKLEQLKDSEINEAKKILAFEATKICRGIDDAEKAQQTAVETFEMGKIGADLPVCFIQNGLSIIDVLIETKMASSKSEARRFVEQGAVKLSDNKIDNFNDLINISDDVILSVGKKNKTVLKLK